MTTMLPFPSAAAAGAEPPDAAERARALELLLARHSPWPLTEPAPGPDDLAQVFAAAMRAPDHGQLRPWRFLTIAGAARERLAGVFAEAARLRDPDDDGRRARSKALAAPLLIALIARVQAPHKVPELEQLLAVGAATMNMLNALHLLGYGGFWATGLNSRDAHVMAALGLASQERLLGFLYVGTPATPAEPPQRPDAAGFVSAWV